MVEPTYRGLIPSMAIPRGGERWIALLMTLCCGAAFAQVVGPYGGPTYQRSRTPHGPTAAYGFAPNYGHAPPVGHVGQVAPHGYAPPQAPRVESGTFQRPYPYHLDYYKQKFGGSYDPYFGNLYGPQPVIVAPSYGGPVFGGGYGAGGYGPLPAVCPHCGAALHGPIAPPVVPPVAPIP